MLFHFHVQLNHILFFLIFYNFYLSKYIIFLDRLESEVDADIQNFDENQMNNYKLLNRILAASLDYNPLFVHFVASQHTVAKYHMYIKKYGKIE